jgi:hypothetical protein
VNYDSQAVLQYLDDCEAIEAELLGLEGPNGFAYKLARRDTDRAWNNLSEADKAERARGQHEG